MAVLGRRTCSVFQFLEVKLESQLFYINLLVLVRLNGIEHSVKGMYQYKLRITYKDEGDGFQAEGLYNDGYCYQVYMRNDYVLENYLKQGLCLFHSRTKAMLFDFLKDYHNLQGRQSKKPLVLYQVVS